MLLPSGYVSFTIREIGRKTKLTLILKSFTEKVMLLSVLLCFLPSSLLGKHSITVYANETGYYYSFIYYWKFFINGSTTVNFTIDTTPKLLILGSTFPMEYGYAIVAVTVIVAAIVGYLSLRILRQRPNKRPP